MVPARTCIGCRRRDTRDLLLRVVERDGAVVADTRATLPGRGAWVHRDQRCVTAAIRSRAFMRALRSPGDLDVTAIATIGQAERLAPAEEQADPPMDN